MKGCTGMSTLASTAYVAGFGPVMVSVTRAGEPFSPPLLDKDMGKAPGVRPNGHWVAIGTPSARCDSPDKARLWDSWHASIGFACGRDARLLGIDSDCDDEVLSDLIRVLIYAYLPGAPVRYVDSPDHHRFLVPVRLSDEMPSGKGMTLRFSDGTRSFAIDFLGEGKQFVALGDHAGTQRPYAWSRDILSQIDGPFIFPEITLRTLTDIRLALVSAMDNSGWKLVSGQADISAPHVAPTNVQAEPEETVTEWLALVPNDDKATEFDDYNTFVGMAHAIWGASGGQAWGRDLWTAWCEQRPQATDGITDKIWESISHPHNGLDWIKVKARIVAPGAAAALMFRDATPVPPEMTDAVWTNIRDRFVWVRAHDLFVDMTTGIHYGHRAFDTELMSILPVLRRELAPGLKGKITATQLIMSRLDVVKVNNMTYWPGRPQITTDAKGHKLLNLWKAPSVPRQSVSAQDVKPWLDHVIYTVGNKPDGETFVKWLAFAIQHPDQKANWHPLLMTLPGVGKDSILAPVLPAIGQGNYKSVNATDLARNWNSYLEAKLIYMSEARQQGQNEKSPHAVMNEIKTYLANPPEMVEVERKGRDKYPVANLSMWVFFSNERVPVYLDVGDRRFWIIENFATLPQPKDYYDRLHAWFAANPFLVANYLMTYPLTAADIQSFKGNAPDNHAKANIINANTDPVDAAIREVIEDAVMGSGFPTLIVEMDEIKQAVKNKLMGRPLPGGPHFASRLRTAGARPAAVNALGASQCVRVSPTQVKRLWILADKDEQGRDYSKLTGVEAGKLYSSQKWPAPTQTRTGVPLGVVSDGSVV